MTRPVAMIAAIKEELEPLLRRLRDATVSSIAGFPVWYGVLAGKRVVIVCSGIGEKQAQAAADAAVLCTPSLLCSIGFGGAIRPGLAVGDLVAGIRFCRFDGQYAAPVAATPLFVNSLPHRFQRGTILTADRIINKKCAANALPADLLAPVLDMETAAVATVATSAGVPFLALRAISDPADEELGFALEELCDQNLRLSIWRILAALVRKPLILPQLCRLAINSRTAATALADGICDLLAAIREFNVPVTGDSPAGAPSVHPGENHLHVGSAVPLR